MASSYLSPCQIQDAMAGVTATEASTQAGDRNQGESWPEVPHLRAHSNRAHSVRPSQQLSHFRRR